MYAISNHVHQGHNQHYNPHLPHLRNGNGQASHHVLQNGHTHQLPPPQPPSQHQRSAPPPVPKEPITVVGVPAVSIQNNQLVVGTPQSSSTRSYTPLKVLGDGSFGTVWLCDWHGTLPPNTPLSPMQCGAGAKPEWAGKRLVAVKRMKKSGGGWEECQKNKELESLRRIPFHANIIPLYDFFLLPASKELYFVFESMEGNLYHLIKTRKGKPLAGGLVSSIFQQISAGLDHIHVSGYFHRDMKPENVLVTTIGLHDYHTLSPIALPNAPPERDVVAIIKLADFGLARETHSEPPYTEYVSTRWYRAPEVLLLSRDYSNPVDMWAFGTIMAELVNLRPLFPGSTQIDQVARICEILGDPSDEYGLDSHGDPIGGGRWDRGIKMAKSVGFAFPKIMPKDIYTLFEPTVPISLIRCIGELLKYDPDVRLTSRQCLEHTYLLETSPRNNIPLPSGIQISTSVPSAPGQTPSPSAITHRDLDPSHSQTLPKPQHHFISPILPGASSSHRSGFYSNTLLPPTPSPSSQKTAEYANNVHMYEQSPHVFGIQEESRSHPGSAIWDAHGNTVNGDHPMDISTQVEFPSDFPSGQSTEIQGSPMVQDNPSRPRIESDSLHHTVNSSPPTSNKLGKLGSLGFGKNRSIWGLGMFGHGDKSHHNGLPPVIEIPAISLSSTPSLERTQSSGTDSKSLQEISPVEATRLMDKKKLNKKEAERLQRDAEIQRRALAKKMQQEQARAVMSKRKVMEKTTRNTQLEWEWSNMPKRMHDERPSKGKQTGSGPIRQNQDTGANIVGSTTVNAAAGRFSTLSDSIRFASPSESMLSSGDCRHDSERLAKARRREFDDDHSMSSSDVHSLGRMSQISFATVDSDPGPSRVRSRPSFFGINRMTSTSSLRTSFDDFPPSARSSNSLSLEGQLVNDFRIRASVGPLGSVSPPPMNALSLSPTLSPTPPWISIPQPKTASDHLPFLSIPLKSEHPTHVDSSSLISYDYGGQAQGYQPNSYGHPPSPGFSLKSDINPIFKVPPLPLERLSSPTALPPFSHLEAVAEGEYPPLSPMSFHTPEDT